MAYDRSDWSRHYDEGRGFRPLGDVERDLFTRHTPAPEGGGRALDVGCGTGELAAHLAGHGYTVDALDFAEGALARARKEREAAKRVRWLCTDIEHDDPAELHDEGYDLITMRLMYPFIGDRTRVVRSLAARLRPSGALVVITPVAANTPSERRHIALDEDETAMLTEGWEQAERCDADGLAFLVLRGPGGSFTPVEKGRPEPQAVLGACVVVGDAAGRVLLGRSSRGMWELPGGRIETGESAQEAAVRELAEESGLTAALDDARMITILHDDYADVRRVSAVVRVTAWTGTPTVCEPHRFTRWEWHELHTLASLGPVFAPSAQALEAVWPGLLPGLPPVHSYPLSQVRHDEGMSRRKAAPRGPRTSAAVCPCGGGSYAECCGHYHRGEAAPVTAEELMRSRYAAFAVGDTAYVLRTWHPDTRPAALDLAGGPRWTGLEILETSGGSAFHSEGTVTFRAHWVGADGQRGTQEERSRFVRVDGAWRYLDGEVA